MLKRLRAYLQRRRYVRAMMRAISLAQGSVWSDDVRVSRTHGLRVIRSFERVNKIPFDPFDHSHVHLIEGMGHHEHFFRDARLMFRKWEAA